MMGAIVIFGASWWLWSVLGYPGLIAALLVAVGTLLCIDRR